MEIVSTIVAIERCRTYEPPLLKDAVDRLCRATSLSIGRGAKVLLKPNLVSGLHHDGLACTHPQFIRAAAEWFLDQGAKVTVGDSPAFGTAKGVMAACGIAEALKGLPVDLINFDKPLPVQLPSGFNVGIAKQVFDCDLLVNLPKVKAHGQMFVTLAVKNYFGCVVGFRKPWIHGRYGDVGHRFEALLVDLLAVLPGGTTLLDGVTAMQGTGPVTGKPYPLGLVAAAMNPVALDTAMLHVLNLSHGKSPLWCEGNRRGLVGSLPAHITYPLLSAETVRVSDFKAPERLKPVSFHPWRLFVGGLKRVRAYLSS